MDLNDLTVQQKCLDFRGIRSHQTDIDVRPCLHPLAQRIRTPLDAWVSRSVAVVSAERERVRQRRSSHDPHAARLAGTLRLQRQGAYCVVTFAADFRVFGVRLSCLKNKQSAASRRKVHIVTFASGLSSRVESTASVQRCGTRTQASHWLFRGSSASLAQRRQRGSPVIAHSCAAVLSVLQWFDPQTGRIVSPKFKVKQAVQRMTCWHVLRCMLSPFTALVSRFQNALFTFVFVVPLHAAGGNRNDPT